MSAAQRCRGKAGGTWPPGQPDWPSRKSSLGRRLAPAATSRPRKRPRQFRRRSTRRSPDRASCRSKAVPPPRSEARVRRRRSRARPASVGRYFPEAWHRKCSEQLAARAAVLRGSAAALPHATGQEYLTYCLTTSRYTPSFASRLRGLVEPSNRGKQRNLTLTPYHNIRKRQKSRQYFDASASRSVVRVRTLLTSVNSRCRTGRRIQS